MKTTKKGLLNISYGVLGQLILIAFAFINSKLVIENYGSAINGLLHSVSQLFAYLSLLEAGVGAATVQALYKPVANNDRFEISAIISATSHFYKKTGIFYFLGVSFIAILYPIFVNTGLPYFFVLGIVLFGGAGGSISFFYQGKYMLLMQAEGFSYVNTRIDIIVNILTNLIKAFLLFYGLNVLIIQLSYLILSVVKALIYHMYIHKHYKNIDLSVKPNFQAIAQKKAAFIHQLSYLVFNSTDIVLLTLLTQDLKIVSVYSLYSSYVTMLLQTVQNISYGYSFKLGQIFATDKEKYNELFHVFEIIYMTLVFSMMSTLYLVLIPFMRIYTRNVTDINYINTLYPLLFVLIPLLTHGRTAESSTIAYAGHYDKTKKYSIIETIINLTITIIGILAWGIFGALLGTIIASIYRTINIIWYSYKHFISGSVWKTIKRWIACFISFSMIVLLNSYNHFVLSSYGQVILLAIVSGIVLLLYYSLLQWIINRKERSAFKALFHKLIWDIRKK